MLRQEFGFRLSSDRFVIIFSYEFHFRTKDEKLSGGGKDGD